MRSGGGRWPADCSGGLGHGGAGLGLIGGKDVTGTAGDDCIVGLGGDDVLDGLGGAAQALIGAVARGARA